MRADLFLEAIADTVENYGENWEKSQLKKDFKEIEQEEYMAVRKERKEIELVLESVRVVFAERINALVLKVSNFGNDRKKISQIDIDDEKIENIFEGFLDSVRNYYVLKFEYNEKHFVRTVVAVIDEIRSRLGEMVRAKSKQEIMDLELEMVMRNKREDEARKRKLENFAIAQAGKKKQKKRSAQVSKSEREMAKKKALEAANSKKEEEEKELRFRESLPQLLDEDNGFNSMIMSEQQRRYGDQRELERKKMELQVEREKERLKQLSSNQKVKSQRINGDKPPSQLVEKVEKRFIEGKKYQSKKIDEAHARYLEAYERAVKKKQVL
ncbi:hypothetical protein GF376_03665 [Candidatus Peregrinibacteria bacterium]|nr:hypothetical protein [Candidatus Peregrinibacteria bacterium]